MMSNRRRFCRGFILVVAFLGFIFICLVGVVENGGMKTTTLDNNRLLGHGDGAEMGRMKGKLALHFISKRRVPNGPDPIHNRRTGNSHQPPGRA